MPRDASTALFRSIAVAVLAYLARQIGAHRTAAADAASFEAAYDALVASHDDVRGAIRSGDAARVAQARKALKGPYSQLFLRFG